MEDDIESLKRNHTWMFVDLPKIKRWLNANMNSRKK